MSIYKNGTLEICTVGICKNMCDYCGQANLIKSYRSRGIDVSIQNNLQMSFDTFKLCIDKVPDNIVIDFAGFVEPFFNPICSDMILYAKQKHYVRIFTTVAGCTLKDIDKIKDSSFSDVNLHLPDNLNILKIDVTDEYIETLTYWIQKIQSKAHVFGPLHNKLESIRKYINIEQKELTPQHLINRGGNVKSNNLVQIKTEKKGGRLWCKSPSMMNGFGVGKLNYNILLPTGDIQLCCCDYSLEHTIGNLLTDSYEDLFKSEEYNRIIQGLNGDESISILCRSCDMSVPQ